MDKIYLETHRDLIVVDEATIEAAKKFFAERGVADRRRHHADRQRAQPLRDLLLHESRAPPEGQGDRRIHGPALRRDHPRRLLLHQLQVRPVHPGQGRQELDRVPAGAAGRGGPRPDRRPGQGGQSQGQDGHQVSQLVRALPGPGLQSGDRAGPLRRALHRDRDAGPRGQSAPATVLRLSDFPLFREPQARRQRRRLGRYRRHDVPGPLRRAALADPLRQGPGDHAVRHPPGAAAAAAPPRTSPGGDSRPASTSTR